MRSSQCGDSERHCCAPLNAGVEFEKRIVANERDNVKFNFLKSTDPYHKYYQLRVSSGLRMYLAWTHPVLASIWTAHRHAGRIQPRHTS